jgi:lycopene beta-cyclase
MKHYHYIFTGSGLAALMTVYKWLNLGSLRKKTILLLDENQKKKMIVLGVSGK